ncbi:nucleotidyltransferase family protein [Arthrobacter sp. HLT1-20]
MTLTTAVLLAAGAGTRLGRGPKALLPFRGTTLVNHAATSLLRGGCSEVVVVIGAGAADVRATPMPPGCRFVENPRWRDGMSSSFAAGIAAAGQGQVLVALVDQPGINLGMIEILLALHRPGRITAAAFRSPHVEPGKGALRRGHPVLFSAEHTAAAAALAAGDSGARAYLAAHAEAVDLVDFSRFSNGADVDTPADLHLLAEPPH